MSVTQSIGMPAAFAAGILSFLSPCVLPLVPAYLSYISGVSVEELMAPRHSHAVRRTGAKALFFVLGFSAVFVALGATATSIGQALSTRTHILMQLAGVIIFIFGLHMLGVLKVNAIYNEKRIHIRLDDVGFAGAVLIGAMFGLGWTPCIGPALMSILTLAADSSTVGRGMLLLAVYSLGLGIPFIVAGFGAGAALSALARVKRHFRKIELASGMLMMAVGVLIFTGNLQRLSTLVNDLIFHAR